MILLGRVSEQRAIVFEAGEVREVDLRKWGEKVPDDDDEVWH